MPEFILDTFIEYGPKRLIFDFNNEAIYLIKSNPEKMFKIITAEESRQDLLRYGINPSILRRINLFTLDMWIEIGKIFVNKPLEIRKVLKVLKGEEKVEFYKKVYEVEEFKTRIIPEFILKLLPEQLRIEEVKRMLLIDEISENDRRKSSIMAYLEADEARKYFEEERKSSDVEKRSQALSALVLSSDLKRNGSMKETLNYIKYIKNDQDPVKYKVAKALSEASYKNYGDDEAEILTSILESMISSRDASFDTVNEVYKLSLKIIQGRCKETESKIFKLAVKIFVKTASKNRVIRFNKPLRTLDKKLDKILFEEISKVIISEMKSENYDLLFDFASSLGERAFEINELQKLIKEVVLKEKSEYQVSTAISLYLADKKTRDERVKELLMFDKSYIKFKEVYLHLHNRRQAWLDDFIERKALRGKFFSGRTIFALPVETGFYRWLPRQQKLFTNIIGSAAVDDSYNSSQRCSYIRMMSNMPVVDLKIFF